MRRIIDQPGTGIKQLRFELENRLSKPLHRARFVLLIQTVQPGTVSEQSIIQG
jgi:hypothetical protein